MNNKITAQDVVFREYFGEIELEYRDPKTKKVIETRREPNIVKIFAKEILAHSVVYDKIWDPNTSTGTGTGTGGSGQGAWVDSNPYDDYKLKYILVGASFDEDGVPLDVNDPRFYERDEVTGLYVPIQLTPGADYDGGLINAIPIDEENNRPLKKIENVYFEPTYQPAGTPLLQPDVRAMNNILVVETTLSEDEYNGFGLVDSDHFTITEVALSGGIEITSVLDCDIVPRDLFLEGPYEATASGGDVITLNNPTDANKISKGDQIKLLPTGTDSGEQVSPYYLVLDKSEYGSDITLDRTPVADSSPIVGDVQIWRDTLRIFSHRILTTPAKKSSSFEIIIRWRIFFT
jgi:hypothetical protein